jgi:hypothetical protein
MVRSQEKGSWTSEVEEPHRALDVGVVSPLNPYELKGGKEHW